MWAKSFAAMAWAASACLLIGCAGTAPRDMPSTRSVVADVLPQVADVKVLRGQLAEARAQGYEDIGNLWRSKVTATCWADERCSLQNHAQCPARVLPNWLQDGLLEKAKAARASAVLLDDEWHVGLVATSKRGKCLATSPEQRYVSVCSSDPKRGLTNCHSELRTFWTCSNWQTISGVECVESSGATLLTDDQAAVSFLRVVAEADARQRALDTDHLEQKIGFIDQTGKMVLAARYDLAGDFSQDRAVVGELVDGKWPSDACWYHLIDKKGRPVPSQGCPKTGRFDSGLVRSSFDSTKQLAFGGYIGLDGKRRLPETGLLTEDFSEGLAAVQDVQTQSCGYIDTSGRQVIPVGTYYVCGAFHEGRAAVATKKVEVSQGLLGLKTKIPLRGYIDRLGQLVLPDVYETTGNFSEGWAYTIRDGQPAFINPQGEVMLRLPKASTRQELARDWTEALRKAPIEFHEGLARLSERPGRVGFIDRSGRVVIAPLYSDAREFHEGLAPAAVTTPSGVTLWGYIRKDGSWAIKPQFFTANSFHQGLAAVGMLVPRR